MAVSYGEKSFMEKAPSLLHMEAWQTPPQELTAYKDQH